MEDKSLKIFESKNNNIKLFEINIKMNEKNK